MNEGGHPLANPTTWTGQHGPCLAFCLTKIGDRPRLRAGHLRKRGKGVTEKPRIGVKSVYNAIIG